jgi:hypothetical protein
MMTRIPMAAWVTEIVVVEKFAEALWRQTALVSDVLRAHARAWRVVPPERDLGGVAPPVVRAREAAAAGFTPRQLR